MCAIAHYVILAPFRAFGPRSFGTAPPGRRLKEAIIVPATGGLRHKYSRTHGYIGPLTY